MTAFIRPIVPDLQVVEACLRESLAVRRLSNFGPAERQFSELLGRFLFDRIVLTSSGHTALMTAIGIERVRRWAIPAFTFESTRLAVVGQGLEAVYVDVGEDGSISVEDLRRTTWDGVVVVCPLSTIPDIRAILNIASGRPVVVDAAGTFGSTPREGTSICVSFHATKTLPIGEGGAISGLSEDQEEAAKRFINFGLVPGDDTPSGCGMNAKLSEYAAAVGLALLGEPIEREIALRLRNARAYQERLGRWIPQGALGDRTVRTVLPVFLPTVEIVERVHHDLVQAGIEHRQYYRPLVPLPGAVSCYRRNICLPVHGDVSLEDISKICDIVMQHV